MKPTRLLGVHHSSGDLCALRNDKVAVKEDRPRTAGRKDIPDMVIVTRKLSSTVTLMVVPSGMTNSFLLSNKRPRAPLDSSLAAAVVFAESVSFAALGDVVQPSSASGKTTPSTITTKDLP